MWSRTMSAICSPEKGAQRRVWAVIAGCIAVVAVLKPILNWPKEIDRFSRLHAEHTVQYFTLKQQRRYQLSFCPSQEDVQDFPKCIWISRAVENLILDKTMQPWWTRI